MSVGKPVKHMAQVQLSMAREVYSWVCFVMGRAMLAIIAYVGY